MSQTDVSSLTAAVAGIQIDGPGGPRLAPTGRVELTEETLLTVLPGELDSAVGSVVQPVVEEDSRTINVDLDDPAYPTTLKQDLAKVLGANPDALFDPAPYDTAPRIDGQTVDRLILAFSGSIELDATDEDDRAAFEAIRLGRYVELRVGGFGANVQGGYKEDKDGVSTVTEKRTVRLTDWHRLTPEQL